MARTRMLVCLLAALVAAIVYWPGITAWFTGEELNGIYAVTSTNDPFAIWSAKDHQPGFFRPVVSFLLWLWFKLWGLSPLAYHLLNFGLHLANSVLVYAVCRELLHILPANHCLNTSAGAAVSGIWFLIWPSHSEPVVWIPCITDLGAAFFGLVSIATYLRWSRTPRWYWAAACVGAFAGGLCTKESVVTLPMVILVLQLFSSHTQKVWRRRDFILPGALFTMVALYLQARLLLMGAYIGGYGEQVHRNYSWDTLSITMAGNLTNTFLPIPHLSLLTKWISLLIALVLLAVGIAFMRYRFKQPIVIVPVLVTCALLLLLPVVNLMVGHYTEQQRFSYLASSFGVMTLAIVTAYLLPGLRTGLAAGAVVAGLCLPVLYNYNRNWSVAGRATEEIMRGVEKLPTGRRYYVLNAPDAYRDAFMLRGGLEMGTRLLGINRGEIRVATRHMQWSPNQTVRVRKINPSDYLLTLDDPAPGTELPGWLLSNASIPYSAEWFNIQTIAGGGFRIQLVGFSPDLDRVAYLEGTRWIVLH